MDLERFNALKAEFDALREHWKETMDFDERKAIIGKMSALLHEAQEIRDHLRNDVLLQRLLNQ